MARDFEDSINLDQLDDADAGALVRERLGESDRFDVDAVEVEVSAGRIRVEGRVGTEGERQHVDQVLDALGSRDYENNVVVDPTTRAERPEAVDLARLEDVAAVDPLGGSSDRTSDTADHLHGGDRSEAEGTRDVQEAIEEGRSYNPPEGPFQEGVGEGERH
jgi:hypothetical protein